LARRAALGYLAPVRGLSRKLYALGCAVLLLGLVRPAKARSEIEIPYTREQTFSGALRYLRVDLSYEVTEKDAKAAYLLFSFTDPELQKKSGHGSIEVVQRERTVRLSVNLPELPSYREELLQRGLLDKLREEYGEPPAAPPPPDPKKPPADSKKPPEDPKKPPEDSKDKDPPQGEPENP
jgi:hypothetical protein